MHPPDAAHPAPVHPAHAHRPDSPDDLRSASAPGLHDTVDALAALPLHAHLAHRPPHTHCPRPAHSARPHAPHPTPVPHAVTALLLLLAAAASPGMAERAAGQPLLALPLAVTAATQATTAAPAFPVDPDLPAEARQFDFWVGEWSVNLRVIQEDLTWKDTRRASAHIHPLLGGKAVLELWDEEQIKGFSLRYFDPARDRWSLWLNWPGVNRAGSFELEGSFRHGRGEFFSESPTSDGGVRLTRYTFSDIGPTSLRWDDAFSSDGGRSWTHNWIMEFSRTAPRPSLPSAGGPTHTYHRGDRCTLDGFRAFDALVGRRTGYLDADQTELLGYQVLDGCAVVLLLGNGSPGAERWFAHLTWNTFASRLELLALDAEPGSPARVYYGAEGASELVFHEGRVESPLRRISIDATPGGPVEIVWEERDDASAPWTRARSARMGG